MTRKDTAIDLRTLALSFFTALADHEIRRRISRETNDLRTLIVAQAFAEANLLDEADNEG